MTKKWKLKAGKTGRPPVRNKMLDELAAKASLSVTMKEEQNAVQNKTKIERVDEVGPTNRKDLKVFGVIGVIVAIVIIFLLTGCEIIV